MMSKDKFNQSFWVSERGSVSVFQKYWRRMASLYSKGRKISACSFAGCRGPISAALLGLTPWLNVSRRESRCALISRSSLTSGERYKAMGGSS